MHDGEKPRPQIAARAPEVELVPGALERVLDQVVGDVAVSHQGARVAPQPGYVLDDEATIHAARILARGKIPCEHPSRPRSGRSATWHRFTVPLPTTPTSGTNAPPLRI